MQIKLILMKLYIVFLYKTYNLLNHFKMPRGVNVSVNGCNRLAACPGCSTPWLPKPYQVYTV